MLENLRFIKIPSVKAMLDVDKDGIEDIFVGGCHNVISNDDNGVFFFVNGKRVFNNDKRWNEEVCWAPVHDSIATVDGYFIPQKSIFSLLLHGAHFGGHEGINRMRIFDDFVQVFRHSDDLKRPTLYLNFDFKTFRYITNDDYYRSIEAMKRNPDVTKMRIKTYYKERYIQPDRLYYYNFEKMAYDSMFASEW